MTATHLQAETAAQAIARVLSERRGCEEPVTPSTRLDALELESIELTEVFIVIEDMTGCVVATDELPDLVTVADFELIPCL